MGGGGPGNLDPLPFLRPWLMGKNQQVPVSVVALFILFSKNSYKLAADTTATTDLH